jgi:glycerol-3-phosphate dehydrogenase
MLLPLSEGKSMGYWLTSIGLKIYDWLAGVKEEDRRRMLSRPQTLHAEPLLKKEGIKGGALYAEYRTDDARLTIEIIKTAVKYGATAINYVKATGFDYDDNGFIRGSNAREEIAGLELLIQSRVIVNATGPWVDEVRQLDHTLSGKRLHLTKGVHIVVDRGVFPVRQAVYFEVEDGRMIFAIPRHTKTYIGTTDTNYKGSKEEVIATTEDVDYLLRGINQNFEGINLTRDKVESSWAGLRPLIHEEGKSESELSRKDEIFQWPSGLISIAGGKLTGYRKMAERVVDMVIQEKFPERKFNPCTTDKILLRGNSFKDNKEVRLYRDKIENQLASFKLDHLSGYLVNTYGSQTDFILLQAMQSGNITQESLLHAELDFNFNHEMICFPVDFLVRRSGMLYFNSERLRVIKDQVITFFKIKLNWSEDEADQASRQLEAEIRNTVAFKNRP